MADSTRAVITLQAPDMNTADKYGLSQHTLLAYLLFVRLQKHHRVCKQGIRMAST